jgi:hypothetical protein
MAINSISLAGVSALRDSVVRAQDAAAKVAQAGEPDDQMTLIESLLELQQAKQDTRLAARIVDAGDNLVGTLIDTLA